MKFLKTLCASILSILLFIVLFGSIILWNAEYHLSSTAIKETVKEVDVKDFLEENLTTTNEDDQTVVEELYQLAEEVGVKEETVDEFLNSDAIKEAVGNIAGNITESLVTGEVRDLMTVDEWNQLIETAFDQINEKLDLNIEEEEKQELIHEVQKVTVPVIEEMPTTEIVTEEFSQTELTKVQFVFGSEMKMIIVGSLAVILVLIFLLKRKEKSWLLYVGTPLMILSLVLLVFGLGVPMIARIVDFEGALFDVVVSNLKSTLLISGAVLLVLAIICFVFYGIGSKKEEKNTKEEAVL